MSPPGLSVTLSVMCPSSRPPRIGDGHLFMRAPFSLNADFRKVTDDGQDDGQQKSLRARPLAPSVLCPSSISKKRKEEEKRPAQGIRARSGGQRT